MALLKALHPPLLYKIIYNLPSEIFDYLNNWM